MRAKGKQELIRLLSMRKPGVSRAFTRPPALKLSTANSLKEVTIIPTAGPSQSWLQTKSPILSLGKSYSSVNLSHFVLYWKSQPFPVPVCCLYKNFIYYWTLCSVTSLPPRSVLLESAETAWQTQTQTKSNSFSAVARWPYNNRPPATAARPTPIQHPLLHLLPP